MEPDTLPIVPSDIPRTSVDRMSSGNFRIEFDYGGDNEILAGLTLDDLVALRNQIISTISLEHAHGRREKS